VWLKKNRLKHHKPNIGFRVIEQNGKPISLKKSNLKMSEFKDAVKSEMKGKDIHMFLTDDAD
jgi:hypothetical protein